MRVFDKKIWNNSDGYGTGAPSGVGVLRVVNNSSDEIEVFYEIDKETYGNTYIAGGTTKNISLTPVGEGVAYFVRYVSGGETNTHNFNGVYRGNSVNTSLTYYDGNICAPIENYPEWHFIEGDEGTLTVSSSGGDDSNHVTYDGTNEVAYGDNADNIVVFEED